MDHGITIFHWFCTPLALRVVLNCESHSPIALQYTTHLKRIFFEPIYPRLPIGGNARRGFGQVAAAGRICVEVIGLFSTWKTHHYQVHFKQKWISLTSWRAARVIQMTAKRYPTHIFSMFSCYAYKIAFILMASSIFLADTWTSFGALQDIRTNCGFHHKLCAFEFKIL